MNKINLPRDGSTAYDLKVRLDGADFILKFRWNPRSGWFVGVSDQDGVAISSPRRVVGNWNLLKGITDDRRPRGILWAWDTTKSNQDIEFADLGDTFVMVYSPYDRVRKGKL